VRFDVTLIAQAAGCSLSEDSSNTAG